MYKGRKCATDWELRAVFSPEVYTSRFTPAWLPLRWSDLEREREIHARFRNLLPGVAWGFP